MTGGKDGLVKLLDLNLNLIQLYNVTETEQGYPGTVNFEPTIND